MEKEEVEIRIQHELKLDFTIGKLKKSLNQYLLNSSRDIQRELPHLGLTAYVKLIDSTHVIVSINGNKDWYNLIELYTKKSIDFLTELVKMHKQVEKRFLDGEFYRNKELFKRIFKAN